MEQMEEGRRGKGGGRGGEGEVEEVEEMESGSRKKSRVGVKGEDREEKSRGRRIFFY